jgi:hypothetical protein
VAEARQRQFRAAGPTTDLILTLENGNLGARAGQLDGGGKSVGTRTHDDCIQVVI